VCVQNPPTAQNWAIGVGGTKWAGSFPSYAANGYWISQGAPVNPNSLYLAQLQERLAFDGSGGGISVVNLGTGSGQITTNQSALIVPVSRSGNRDGSTTLQFSFENGAEKLFNVAAFLPASTAQGNVTFSLRTNAFVPTNRLVRVTLVHGDAYSAGVTNELTINVERRNASYEAWQHYHFSAEEIADPLVSARAVSFLRDGVPNFVKYALNQLPWAEVAPNSFVSLQLVNDRWHLSYDWFKAINDVQLIAEVSYDLQHWNGGDEFFETSKIDFGDFERVTLMEKEFAPVRFLRIRFVAE
jgi:hypothetical protein